MGLLGGERRHATPAQEAWLLELGIQPRSSTEVAGGGERGLVGEPAYLALSHTKAGSTT
jgi:hypothetical protein